MVAGWSDAPLARFATYRRGRVLAALVVGLVVLFQIAGSENSQRLQHAVFDFYQRVQPREVKAIPVAIVAIDEQSLRQYGQWPWPRTLLARLIDRIHAAGALSIGLDIILAEPDRMSPQEFAADYPGLMPDLKSRLTDLPSNDAVLAETLSRIPVVIGRSGQFEPTPDAAAASFTPVQFQGGGSAAGITRFRGHLTNVPGVMKAAAGFGYLNAIRDPDGQVRRMPVVMTIDGQTVPSMALELIRSALGANWITVNTGDRGVASVEVGEALIETDARARLSLHFSGPHAQRRVSAADVLSDRPTNQTFAGQLVLVGVTGLGLADIATTPVAARMDGVEVQAEFIENMLYGTRLKRPPFVVWSELLVLAASALLLIILLPRHGPVLGAGVLAALLATQFGAGFQAFTQASLLSDPSGSALASVAAYISLTLTHVTEADRDRRLMNAQLERERLENARMAGELAAARDIQIGILPNPAEIENLPASLDVHASLEPAREVGGDLYDLHMVDQHRLYFMIGDVSGKGVPASLFMALSKALCKSAVLRENASIADLMMTANGEISRENPASMFVTAVAGIIDSRTGEIEFCNAGHDHPYVVCPGQPARLLESTGGPPLCVMDDFPYPVERAQLRPGDMLVLTTDGVSEAMTADKQMYGTARLSALLDAFEGEIEPMTMVGEIYKDVKTFADGAEPNDDITILALKYRPAG